jgi:O-succinylbenzoic acid--CoA ligase
MTTSSIILNGEKVDSAIAKSKLVSGIPDWKKAIFQFLLEWWNNESHITVSTSGSTGAPKTIQRAKGKMRISAQMTGQYFGFKKGQKALLCLPANFIAGKMMLVRAIEWGLELDCIEPKIDLTIPKSNYSFSAMIPQQVETNLNQLEAISKLLIGGASVNSDLESRLHKKATHFFVSYGMTETVSHIAIRNLQSDTPQIYSGLNFVSFSVTSNNELIVNAPHLLNTPIKTTDVVKLINEKQFIWLGRTDFVINSGGLKLFPEALENQISHLISQPFFIHKQQDEKWGEIPILIIQGNSIDTNNLENEMSHCLNKNEIPKKIVIVDQFSLTANGKLDRNATFSSIK